MAETSSETKRARLERELYDNIKNLIIQAIRDGGSDSAQSIHSAMAQAMCDTITDIKGPYQSQITQTFVERWSLTTSHMEHKLNYFMRMLLVKNKKFSSGSFRGVLGSGVRRGSPEMSQLVFWSCREVVLRIFCFEFFRCKMRF